MSKRGNRTKGYEPRRIIDLSRTWYVAATFGIAHEDDEDADRAADCALRKAGVDVWMPQRRITTVRRGVVVDVDALFFPGYLFCGCAGPDAKVLRDCKHVATVLGIDAPLAIPHGVMQAIADAFTGDVQSERKQAAALFEVGQIARVCRGPFASFYATIVEVLSRGRIKADVNIFGRATPVECEPDWLEPSRMRA